MAVDPFHAEDIAEMYRTMSIKEIAQKEHLSTVTVTRVLRAEGVTIRRQVRRPRRSKRMLRWIALCQQLYREGLSVQEIGRRTRRNYSWVYRVLVDSGEPMRPVGSKGINFCVDCGKTTYKARCELHTKTHYAAMNLKRVNAYRERKLGRLMLEKTESVEDRCE